MKLIEIGGGSYQKRRFINPDHIIMLIEETNTYHQIDGHYVITVDGERYPLSESDFKKLVTLPKGRK